MRWVKVIGFLLVSVLTGLILWPRIVSPLVDMSQPGHLFPAEASGMLVIVFAAMTVGMAIVAGGTIVSLINAIEKRFLGIEHHCYGRRRRSRRW